MSWFSENSPQFKIGDVLILNGYWAVRVTCLYKNKAYCIYNYASPINYIWHEDFLFENHNPELCPEEIINQLFLVD